MNATEQEGKLRTIKHADRAQNLDADGVTAQYSERIRQKFAGLYSLVENARGFDHRVVEGLRELSGAREQDVNILLPVLLGLGKETMRHALATGDKEVEQYLTDIIEELAWHGTSKPIRLLKGRPQSRVEMS